MISDGTSTWPPAARQVSIAAPISSRAARDGSRAAAAAARWMRPTIIQSKKPWRSPIRATSPAANAASSTAPRRRCIQASYRRTNAVLTGPIGNPRSAQRASPAAAACQRALLVAGDEAQRPDEGERGGQRVVGERPLGVVDVVGGEQLHAARQVLVRAGERAGEEVLDAAARVVAGPAAGEVALRQLLVEGDRDRAGHAEVARGAVERPEPVQRLVHAEAHLGHLAQALAEVEGALEVLDRLGRRVAADGRAGQAAVQPHRQLERRPFGLARASPSRSAARSRWVSTSS